MCVLPMMNAALNDRSLAHAEYTTYECYVHKYQHSFDYNIYNILHKHGDSHHNRTHTPLSNAKHVHNHHSDGQLGLDNVDTDLLCIHVAYDTLDGGHQESYDAYGAQVELTHNKSYIW